MIPVVVSEDVSRSPIDGSVEPLVVEGVVVRYGRTSALESVTFSLSPGVTGLLGPNGAGKSSLLRVVATAQVPTAGTVSILGIEPRTARQLRVVRGELGYLPQHPGYYPHFSVEEFVNHLALLKEIGGRGERADEVDRVLALVDLDSVRRTKARALSGGMRQRMALACAVLGDPPLLILDEPTVGLDPEQRLRFRELVTGLGVDRAVLLSTHLTDDVAQMCERVIVLEQGQIGFDGSPQSLAQTASGMVWRSPEREPSAIASWRTGEGHWRNIGRPRGSFDLVEPSIDDGYLLIMAQGSLDDSTDEIDR